MLAQVGTAALAQGLLAAFQKAARPSPSFWALRVGDWTRVLFVPLLMYIGSLIKSSPASNAFQVVALSPIAAR